MATSVAVRRRRTQGRRSGGAGAVLLVGALLLSLSFLPRATGVALLLGRWQRLALGEAAPVIPAILALAGLFVLLTRGRVRFTRRVAGLLLGGAVVLAVLHAPAPAGREFGWAGAGRGAGAVGGALVWAGRTFFGEAGLWALIVAGGSSAILLLSGASAAQVADVLASAARGAVRTVVIAVAMLIALARAGGLAAGRVVRAGASAAEPHARRWNAALLRYARGFAESAAARIAPVRPAGRSAAGAATETGERTEPLASALAPAAAAGPPAGADFALQATPADAAAADSTRPAAGEPESEPPAPPAVRRRARRSQEIVQQESLLPSLQEEYELPPLSLLGDLTSTRRAARTDPSDTARALEQTLASFGVEVKVTHWEQGPVVTRFEVQPAPGVKVQKITSLTNDIALNLAAPSVRIEAPIPGKSVVGIELPNQKASLVHLKEILSVEAVQRLTGALVVGLGKDIAGHPIVADLTDMPHMLIAGATGSGKSVAINAIIASLLFRYTPRQVRFVMIDPKRIELTNYNEVPHLLIPVVTNPRAVAGALKEMLRVMEQRFEEFARVGVRNIQAYNTLTDTEPLPFIVIIIDELADLMMVAPADFEDVIVRLAQMTRATGIHLVVATQRPSVDVITGLIKANIPSRIAFAVSSQVDSRTIIDGPGAEKLLGRGDMLFLPIGASRPVRAQGSFVADGEIQALVDWWRGQGKPAFDPTLMEAGRQSAAAESGEDSERMVEAARLTVRAGYGSVSLLQRKMRIGYVTAARLIDQLEERGIVGPAQGSSPREVLVGLEGLDRLFRQKPQEK